MRNEYLNDVRKIIEQNESLNAFGGKLFQYEIGIDEVLDHTLVSKRAYGTRQHSDIVRVASGVSYSCDELPQKIILLPTLLEVVALMKKHEITT